nr:hypothetical protein [Corynebacterium lactis]
MELLSTVFDMGIFPFILLSIMPWFYPYFAKGDLPYKREEYPDAAWLVVTIEGIVLCTGIEIILAWPWSYIFDGPIHLYFAMAIVTVISGAANYVQFREKFNTNITCQGIEEYSLMRYSWIINRKN